MIVDAHMHLLRAGNINNEKWAELGMAPASDTAIEELVGWLTEAGVKKAVVMGQDQSRIWNFTFGDEYVMEAAFKYPHFFVPFVSVEPIDSLGRLNREALERFQSAIENGCKGVLLTPPYGQYFSNHRCAYPFYEIAERKGIVVQYHHGAGFGPPILGHLGYSNLLDLNDVIIDFPNLRIVVEHLAFPWTDQLMVLMATNKNIYSDLAMLYERRLSTTWNLVIAKEYGVIDRIMYASDYCWREERDGKITEPAKDMKRWIQYIRTGLNEICGTTGWGSFEHDEIEGFLWRNADRLYGLGLA